MTCAEAHERVRRSNSEWLRLELVGVQRFADDQPPLELRNCPVCGSTLARTQTAPELTSPVGSPVGRGR